MQGREFDAVPLFPGPFHQQLEPCKREDRDHTEYQAPRFFICVSKRFVSHGQTPAVGENRQQRTSREHERWEHTWEVFTGQRLLTGNSQDGFPIHIVKLSGQNLTGGMIQ